MINFLNISRAKYCFLISFIFKVYFVLNQKLNVIYYVFIS